MADRRAFAPVVYGALVAIVGCSSNPEKNCKPGVEYKASKSIEELAVPSDKDQPAGSERLVIPPRTNESAAVGQGEGEQAGEPTCLERPPDYFGE